MSNPPGGPLRHIFKGRGAVSNAADRYTELHHEAVDDGWPADETPARLPTRLHVDRTRSVIATNRSPDVPFDRSINPYRGCEHGCIYCYARPTHAWLGYSPGLDFETEIVFKPNASALLRDELARPGYQCRLIALGTNTDPYQPAERDKRITRQILAVLAECRHPVSITTKAALVERDIDILAPMAARGLAQVQVSVTTLDDDLARRLEPRTAAPRRRLRTVRALRAAGIPVTVLVAPVIPLLNDAEIEQIVAAAAGVDALAARYILLRLPLEVAGLFEQWLIQHYPGKAKHVLSLVRQTRAGKVYRSGFDARMRGTGQYADLIATRFRLAVRRHALDGKLPALDETAFRPPGIPVRQLSLW